jgi:hypothetical protein
MSLENASILVSDLQLPEGVETRSPAQQAVVTAELTRAAVTSRSAGDESDGAPAGGEASGGDESGD